jgi:hypothetical protein
MKRKTICECGRMWTIRVVVCLFLCHLISLPSALAQDSTTPDYKIKAAFLYNFAKLTDWPASAFSTVKSPLVIGVLGRDPFGALLEETITDHKIDGRSLIIRRFNSLKDVKDCHILFICESEKENLAEILTTLRDKAILTVSDTAQFTGYGGMIQLIKKQEGIRFAINTSAASHAQLKLSSKLLRLATNLQAGPLPGGDQ